MGLGATLRIKMDTTAVRQGIKRIRSGFARLTASVRGFGAMMAKMKAPLGKAFGAINVELRETMRFLTLIRDEMKMTGHSAKEILLVRNALHLVGVDAETASQTLIEMNKRIAEAREVGPESGAGKGLKMLNLSLRQMLLMKPAAAFEEIMKAVQNSNRPLGELQQALDLIFGGEGMKMVALGKDWEKKMKDAKEVAEDLAEAVTEKGFKGITKMQIATTKFRNSMRMAFVELIDKLPMADIANAVVEILKGLPQLITTISEFFSKDLFGDDGFFKKTVPDFFKNAGTWFMENVIAKAKELGKMIADGIVESLPEGLKKLLGIVDEDPVARNGRGARGGGAVAGVWNQIVDEGRETNRNLKTIIGNRAIYG